MYHQIRDVPPPMLRISTSAVSQIGMSRVLDSLSSIIASSAPSTCTVAGAGFSRPPSARGTRNSRRRWRLGQAVADIPWIQGVLHFLGRDDVHVPVQIKVIGSQLQTVPIRLDDPVEFSVGLVFHVII